MALVFSFLMIALALLGTPVVAQEGYGKPSSSMAPPPVYSPPPPIEGEAPLDPPLHAQVIEYEVESGDTLSEIANSFGTDAETLAIINDLSNWNALQPGDTLKILTVSGLLHRVGPGESASAVADRHGVNLADLLAANGLREGEDLPVGEEVIVPGARPEREAVLAVRGELYRWPTRGRISSPFGYRWGGFHTGIDIATGTGTPVTPTRAGRVSHAGWRGAYGYLVIVDHGGGMSSYYAHLSAITANVGQNVTQDTLIGRVGSTGRSTGPHLHFEIRENGDPNNPMNYLP
ncbi:MAG: M23 family metallopeptidase [Bacillota bacterium]